jgi:hypothetical protein
VVMDRRRAGVDVDLRRIDVNIDGLRPAVMDVLSLGIMVMDLLPVDEMDVLDEVVNLISRRIDVDLSASDAGDLRWPFHSGLPFVFEMIVMRMAAVPTAGAAVARGLRAVCIKGNRRFGCIHADRDVIPEFEDVALLAIQFTQYELVAAIFPFPAHQPYASPAPDLDFKLRREAPPAVEMAFCCMDRLVFSVVRQIHKIVLLAEFPTTAQKSET